MKLSRWDFFFDRRAPGAWASIAGGIGLVFASIRLAWGLQREQPPQTLEGLFTQLLPSMIGGVAVGLMTFGVIRFRISDHDRRLQRIEEHKVEKELFTAELRAVTARLEDFGQIQNDVVKDLIDRLDRRAQDVAKH